MGFLGVFVCFNEYEVTSCMFIEMANDSECGKERKNIFYVPYKIHVNNFA